MSDSTPETRLYGGIDLGGTKIISTLYGADLTQISSRRRLTPRESYDALLAALTEECRHLAGASGRSALRIGVGIPGIVDPATGIALTANLPATGHTLAADLQAASGVPLSVANDCKCFALSEASGGAGAGMRSVFGLVIGTGLAGGLCVDGRMQAGSTGLAGEIGHVAIPATLAADLDLPILTCGCGRRGCYETLVSGPGLAALWHRRTGREDSTEVVAASSDPEAVAVMDQWLRLAGELVWMIQVTLDPDCIVLGGGLSQIPNLDARIARTLAAAAFPDIRLPRILPCLHGAASGTRGAAMLAASAEDQDSR